MLLPTCLCVPASDAGHGPPGRWAGPRPGHQGPPPARIVPTEAGHTARANGKPRTRSRTGRPPARAGGGVGAPPVTDVLRLWLWCGRAAGLRERAVRPAPGPRCPAGTGAAAVLGGGQDPVCPARRPFRWPPRTSALCPQVSVSRASPTGWAGTVRAPRPLHARPNRNHRSRGIIAKDQGAVPFLFPLPNR